MTAVGGVATLQAGAGVGLVVGARTIAAVGAREIQALDIRPLGDAGRRLAASALGGVSLTTPNDGSSRAASDAYRAVDALSSGADDDAPSPATLAALRRANEAVRQEERAHAAAGGALAGPPIYETRTGPDGRPYAVAGSVRVSSRAGGDAEQQAEDAARIRAAALAPNAPSAQDGRVAAQAGADAARLSGFERGVSLFA